MSEMSDMHKLIMAMELAKTAQVGMELTYFDVIELLGELESLKDYIAELEEKQRWISVSERLPEVLNYVYISDRHGSTNIAVWSESTKMWVLKHSYARLLWHQVTHWMPLPEPPEVEE